MNEQMKDDASVSTEQAMAAVRGWLESGMPLYGLHQVAVALAHEVDAIRAGISDMVGCARGDPAICAHDQHGWTSCCRARLRAVELGLLPSTVPSEPKDDDGA